ncbi:MAG: hypothetical protein ABIZ72_10775 [Candidatus Limnocylindrales bacterium]
MSPRPRLRIDASSRPVAAWHRVIAALLAVVAIAVIVAGCGAKFDPTGPCTANGSAPGAYPELEAAVPRTFRGAGPSDLDSGRACTPDGLGTLASHGVTEMRFAGATWSTGTDSGLSLALFAGPTGPTLTRDWVTEFYETGAKSGKNVTSVETTDYPVGAALTGRRIDVLNGESYQSVIVWDRNGQVAVALVADFIREIQTKEAHDVVVRAAVDAFGT